MATDPNAVAEYEDENGNTFQLNEADAKRLGYRKVGTRASTETKVVEAEATAKPSARRTATTK